MKSLFLTAIVLCSAVSAKASSLDEAKAAYAARDYDGPGAQKAQTAADLYAELAALATEPKTKAVYLVGQSEALYFVADSTSETAIKVEKYGQGLKLADQAAQLLGLADVTKVSDAQAATLKATLSAEDLKTLGDALYARGTNLGKWGQAKGVATSLDRWKELRTNMELLGKLGLEATHEYGSARTLGKAFATVPRLLGGDTKLALRYLSNAVEKTLAAGESYSTNGYNNIYYAEVLRLTGDPAKAKQLLQNFVKADPATLNPAMVPETRRAINDAKELLKDL